uniref:Uncharacterized protein n=1 Tax=Acrobeloides nanus TaxID=290746 RepID=A0A914DZK2_9BILA
MEVLVVPIRIGLRKKLENEGKWKSSGSSSTTSAPGTGVTIAPGIPTLPPQTCSIFCPTRPGSTTPPKADVEGFLKDKIDTIKKVLGLLGPIFGSSGKPTGPLDGVLSGLNKLLDNIVEAVLSGVKGDLGPLKKLVDGLNLVLANLPKEEAPVDTPTLPRTLAEPTRVKRQGIQLLGLEGLIKNVLMLVRQLLNDLLPGLQKLLKDIGPDLLNLLDKLLESLKELLDKVLTGLINALGGNSSLLSGISSGLSLLGMLG